MSQGLNVCGVLVHAQPARLDEVEAGIAAIPGVETHGQAAGGRILVTIEDTADMSAADALSALNKVDGVIAAALVYHEFDPNPDQTASSTENRA